MISFESFVKPTVFESGGYTKNRINWRPFTNAIRTSLVESQGPFLSPEKNLIWDWRRCNFPLFWGAYFALFSVFIVDIYHVLNSSPPPAHFHYFCANLVKLWDPYFKKWDVCTPRASCGSAHGNLRLIVVKLVNIVSTVFEMFLWCVVVNCLTSTIHGTVHDAARTNVPARLCRSGDIPTPSSSSSRGM